MKQRLCGMAHPMDALLFGETLLTCTLYDFGGFLPWIALRMRIFQDKFMRPKRSAGFS
jgi:hypothetical protein